MGDYIIIILALFFVIVAMIAIVVFLIKGRTQHQIVTTTATIIRAYSEIQMINENFSTNTVDSTSSYKSKKYLIDLKIKGGKKLVLKAKKKNWLLLSDGDYGTVTYKGNQLISFIGQEKQDQKPLFSDTEKVGPTGYIYGEANESGFNYQSFEKKEVDMNDLTKLIKLLKKDESDWFFVISKDNHDELQIERAPDHDIKETKTINGLQSEEIYSMSKLQSKVESFMKL